MDHGGDKGCGTKASDRFSIPLCQHHHDEQHGKIGTFKRRGGWETFEAKYGIDAKAMAADYWRNWPGRAAYERKLKEAGDA